MEGKFRTRILSDADHRSQFSLINCWLSVEMRIDKILLRTSLSCLCLIKSILKCAKRFVHDLEISFRCYWARQFTRVHVLHWLYFFAELLLVTWCQFLVRFSALFFFRVWATMKVLDRRKRKERILKDFKSNLHNESHRIPLRFLLFLPLMPHRKFIRSQQQKKISEKY